ncbi:MAG: SBBP repeat-containing protein [Chlorobi bacterium]|nr:SBBP repeat-containing protein [Chlorobiota bacterium]MCI0716041.1 SBBP repeat-containing protein [Chlorobiota bacterium]
MKKLIIFLAVSSLFMISSLMISKAQVSEQWVQKYNGPGSAEDAATSIAVDASGNIYVTGYSTGSGSGHDYTTIKYSPSGSQQWVARYNGPGNALDEALAIAVDAAGNVYITGRSAAGSTEYTYDYATIKYNSSGTQLWAARYNSPVNGQDVAFAIAVDSEGNVYVTGQSGHPALDSDIGTIKYNSAGVQQWAVEYDLTGNWDTGLSIAVDNLNNVYVAGFHSTNWGTAYLDYVTIKYNAQGIQQWTRGYNGAGNNSDNAIVVGLDGSGNVYVTGFSTGQPGQVYDIATIKYNPSGDQQWVQTYSSGSPSIDVPRAMKIDESGNVYITGAISFDIGTLKYNSNGVQQWVARYDFNGNFDAARSIAIDGQGNSYVTGVSGKAPNESLNDYATIKYSSSGAQQWVQRYDGAASDWDEAYGIAIDNSGNVYVAGYSNENAGLNDITTIKYSQTVGINVISSEVPNSFSLFQNYPNPFNPVTKIRFNVASVPRTDIKLVVYDVAGREITTLVNQQLNPGTYETEWDASNHTSGIYFYRITAGDYSETKKMILIK